MTISLSTTTARMIISHYANNLKRSEPSRIEIDCTKAGANMVLQSMRMKRNDHLKHAHSKRITGDIDSAELHEFAAEQFKLLIDDMSNIL